MHATAKLVGYKPKEHELALAAAVTRIHTNATSCDPRARYIYRHTLYAHHEYNEEGVNRNTGKHITRAAPINLPNLSPAGNVRLGRGSGGRAWCPLEQAHVSDKCTWRSFFHLVCPASSNVRTRNGNL